MAVRVRMMRPSVSVTPSSIADLLERGGLARRVDAHAELERLQRRLADEVAAGDTEREAEEVLDARCRGGLPAGGDRVQQDGAQTLGGAVDRRGESRPDPRRRRRGRRPRRPATGSSGPAARRRCPGSPAGSARPGCRRSAGPRPCSRARGSMPPGWGRTRRPCARDRVVPRSVGGRACRSSSSRRRI